MQSLYQNLIAEGIIEKERLDSALAAYTPGGEPFHRVLVTHKLIGADELLPKLCRGHHIPELDEEKLSVVFAPATFADESWLSHCKDHRILPLSVHGDVLDVAMVDPFDFGSLVSLENAAHKMVNRYYCSETLFRNHQADIIPPAARAEEDLNPDMDAHSEEIKQDAVSKVKHILDEAVKQRASDIHIEPSERDIHVRIRVDGLLQEFEVLPRNLYSQLVCRIKILSNLDIAEKRLPQDGAISYTFNHEPVEFRVSTLPGVHGENIVLRILDPHSLPPDLKEIGFSGPLLATYDRLVRKPYGIILVTGPTGSGKTTTLYSTLSLVNQETSNIITIEDPVEYRRDGIHQIQINTKAGMTFSGALRSILRQDPDVIMVGEMRDSETAQIAIRAALTGHLVFSTLHTNDSPSSFIRLIDMGVAPYLVTSSILGILAQRLVRKICSHCKAPYRINDEERAYLTYKLKQYGIASDLSSLSFYHGSGCPRCRGRGYHGRTASFEFIAMDSSVSQAILTGKGQEAIAAAALDQGYRALWRDAWDKVLQGITSVEELMRVIN